MVQYTVLAVAHTILYQKDTYRMNWNISGRMWSWPKWAIACVCGRAEQTIKHTLS